jgi:hypothetical protein
LIKEDVEKAQAGFEKLYPILREEMENRKKEMEEFGQRNSWF